MFVTKITQVKFHADFTSQSAGKFSLKQFHKIQISYDDCVQMFIHVICHNIDSNLKNISYV